MPPALPNGILYIKGGDVESELKNIRAQSTIYNISDFFEEDFFETKKIVHIWKK
jgi:16S rRNA (guanine527-N7)-methyltransferase